MYEWKAQTRYSYKTFFMLNSIEHEISTAHKKVNLVKSKYFSCFKTLRCCIYLADSICCG